MREKIFKIFMKWCFKHKRAQIAMLLEDFMTEEIPKEEPYEPVEVLEE